MCQAAGAQEWRTLKLLAFKPHRPGPIRAHGDRLRPFPLIQTLQGLQIRRGSALTWSPLSRLFLSLTSFLHLLRGGKLRSEPYDGLFILELYILP